MAIVLPQIQPIGLNPVPYNRLDYSPLFAGPGLMGGLNQGLQQRQQRLDAEQMRAARQQQMDAQREEQRMKSIVLGAAEVAGLPVEQQLTALEQRSKRLVDAGIDNSDTLEAIELLQTDPQAFQDTVNRTLNYGYMTGMIKKPDTTKMYTESKIPGYAFNQATGKLELADAALADEDAKRRALKYNEEQTKKDLDEMKTTFERSKVIRNEFDKKSTEFKKVRDAYGRVKASADTPDASGDIALIFNFMKMLDPGSTVREGEYATAEQSGSVDKKVVNLYNKLTKGERLTDDQRKMFVQRSKSLYDKAAKQNTVDFKDSLRLGERYGLTEADIFGEGFDPLQAPATESYGAAVGVADGTMGQKGDETVIVKDGQWVPYSEAEDTTIPKGSPGRAVGMSEGAMGELNGQQYIVKNGFWVPYSEATTQVKRTLQRNQMRRQ